MYMRAYRIPARELPRTSECPPLPAATFPKTVHIPNISLRAWNRSAIYSAGLVRGDTTSVMASLIKAGVLTIAKADAIKDDWKANHRFTLAFTSFAEVI